MHKIPNLIIYAPSNVACTDKSLNYGKDVGYVSLIMELC